MWSFQFQFVIKRLLAFNLKVVRLRLSQPNLICLFKTIGLLQRMFFPTFTLIWKVSVLALKFCCTFMSIQSSFSFPQLYILYSWIASLYLAKFIGNALFSWLCSLTYEVLRSLTLFKILRAFEDTANNCCLNLAFKFSDNHISQL